MGAKVADVIRRLAAMSFTIDAASGGGSHYKIKREGQRTVPLSLHNGLRGEIDDRYLKIIARELNVSYDALRHGD